MKEKLLMYRCHNLDGAKKLFNMFQDMKLDNLDREQFFDIYNRCKRNVLFCVRFNTWQIILPDCNLFDGEIIEMK